MSTLCLQWVLFLTAKRCYKNIDFVCACLFFGVDSPAFCSAWRQSIQITLIHMNDEAVSLFSRIVRGVLLITFQPHRPSVIRSVKLITLWQSQQRPLNRYPQCNKTWNHKLIKPLLHFSNITFNVQMYNVKSGLVQKEKMVWRLINHNNMSKEEQLFNFFFILHVCIRLDWTGNWRHYFTHATFHWREHFFFHALQPMQ